MQAHGENFGSWVWSYVDGKPILGDGKTFPASTSLSERLSKDLKKRGFKFVGPTIVYAWMQAVGLVNDHSEHCFCR
jgi:DNA-3-methyladenine glycosylase I